MSGRSEKKPRLVVLCGPTGCGKSSAAMELARHLPIEIVNADSMQVYRYMDIGTATPAPQDMARVPHHLYSIIDPNEHFDVARYRHRAGAAVAAILDRGSVPVVVGGSGLYLRALTRGLVAAPAGDAGLRRELEALDGAQLHQRLIRVDPEAAGRIHPNDRVRLVRALEVHGLTGTAISEHQRRHAFQETPYACLRLCLVRERRDLYRRIEQRAVQMLEQGLVAEMRALLGRGYDPGLRALQSIGYRQVGALLAGAIDEAEALRLIRRDTKRFAKRQLTWLRREPGLVSVELPGEAGRVVELVKNFLNNTPDFIRL